ncbi:MAG: hypothetical protein ACK4U0_13045 [Mesorhizobium sp.]
MQVIDIRITPASDASSVSRVCFVGEGGDEVAVTISDRLEGGSTIDQELVAKAKVMLLHAAAAQVRDAPTMEPETGLADDSAADEGDPMSTEDMHHDPDPNSDEASTNDATEEDDGAREELADDRESRSGFGIDPPG